MLFYYLLRHVRVLYLILFILIIVWNTNSMETDFQISIQTKR